MKGMLGDISTWSVLKWAALVLIAGFIGHFGKVLAQAIMEKIRICREKGKI
ncbi:MAG: hypothetical protein PHN75_15660 [Syntrophales bacterium]|nr:hypothetical protein [Syntrophales bacterium]